MCSPHLLTFPDHVYPRLMWLSNSLVEHSISNTRQLDAPVTYNSWILRCPMAIAEPTAVKSTSGPVTCAGNRLISPPHHLVSCPGLVMVCHPFSRDRITTHRPRRGLIDAHPRSTYTITVARIPSMSPIKTLLLKSSPLDHTNT